jgi:exonuclease III
MPAFLIIVHVMRYYIQTTAIHSRFLNHYSQIGKRRRSRSHSKSISRSKDQSEPSISPAAFRRNQTSKLPIKDGLMAEVDERFEIISWNVNGASRFLKSDTPKITSFFTPSSSSSASTKDIGLDVHNRLRKFLKRHAWPQVVCLQEVKINPQDSSTRKALQIAANYSEKQDSGPAYTAQFSLPRDKYNATGFGRKVHGVCTLIHTSLLPSSVTREVDWDLEGRVLITEFPKSKLAVVNGYWVNGTTNPYRSPETGEVVGTRHDLKRKFHALMLAEAKSYEGKGYHVVLVGDMNIAPSPIDGYPNLRLGHEHVRNRQDFNDKFLSANLENNGMR